MGKFAGLRNAGVCGIFSRREQIAVTRIGVSDARRWSVMTVSFCLVGFRDRSIGVGDFLVR